MAPRLDRRGVEAEGRDHRRVTVVAEVTLVAVVALVTVVGVVRWVGVVGEPGCVPVVGEACWVGVVGVAASDVGCGADPGACACWSA